MAEDEGREQKKPRYKVPTEKSLMNAALAYLNRYATSTENLRQVLMRRIQKAAQCHDRDPEEFVPFVEAVMSRCEAAGFLSDRDYAETKVVSLRRAGKSRRQIEMKLRQKGVDGDLISEALAENNSDDFSAAMRTARKRRLGPWASPDKREERREKDLARLCRAGFSFEIARKVIDGDHDEF